MVSPHFARIGRGLIAGACCVVLAASISGCSGTSTVIPNGPAGGNAIPAGRIASTLTIRVPRRKARIRGRGGSYISPGTQSLSLEIYTSPGKVKAVSITVNLTPGSPGCVTKSSAVTCTIPLQLAVGKYEAYVATYSGQDGSGSVLSQSQNDAVSIVAGIENHILLTLYGVPASFLVTPVSGVTGTQLNGGFTMSGIYSAARQFNIVARDASGYAIVGTGAPSFSIASSNKSFAVTEPTAAQPDTFGVTPAGSQPISTTLTATASFPDPTTCQRSGAICSLPFAANYSPFSQDDWITFAHDFQRTGLESNSTGITTSTVAQLKQRWKTTVPNGTYGSPVVYNGNVILITRSPPAVYDLSANDGSVLWHTASLGVGSKATPTIDTADGLVIVGTSHTGTGGRPYPSTLYALNLANGNIAWQTTLGGIIRAATIYENGVVYEGWAGGDPPNCLNGGVTGINAKTGAILWTWYTNPVTNPGGGGGVWGALAWDGSHVIFGTGNSCNVLTDMAQGAAAVNANGTTAWSFQADPVYGDSDTGGGVMLQNGEASFINKNGSLYRINSSSGALIHSTPLGASSGFGGFATPTSDGSTTIVGAGSLKLGGDGRVRTLQDMCRMMDFGPPRVIDGSSDYDSALDAVDAAGNILWSITMTNPITNYAAINNGIVFAGMDDNVDAIGITSGHVLWQLPSSAIFVSAPVVVPSGVYAADSSGNVYAMSLPPAGASSLHRVHGGTNVH